MLRQALCLGLLGVLATACSSVSPRADFEKSLQTSYPLEDRIVGGYDTTQLTDAPLRALVVARLDVPAEEAFALMLTGIHEWFPGVQEFTWTNTEDGEIVAGSVRTGEFEGSRMVEPVRFIDPGHVYVYQIDLEATEKWIPVDVHMGIFTVDALTDSTSLVIWRQYFTPCVPLTGQLVAYVMEDRVAEQAFDELVERYGGERLEYR